MLEGCPRAVEGAPALCPEDYGRGGDNRSYFDEGIRIWRQLFLRIEPDEAARAAKPKSRRISEAGADTRANPIPP